ncbi:hypothetical protein Hanom_Chr17g01560851 [Helianthus anomalus]
MKKRTTTSIVLERSFTTQFENISVCLGEQILEVSRADMEPTIMGYEIASGGLPRCILGVRSSSFWVCKMLKIFHLRYES